MIFSFFLSSGGKNVKTKILQKILHTGVFCIKTRHFCSFYRFGQSNSDADNVFWMPSKKVGRNVIRLWQCIDATIFFFFVSSNGQSFFVASNFFWLPKQTFRNERNERNGTRRGPLWGAEWSGASEVSGENVCKVTKKILRVTRKKL